MIRDASRITGHVSRTRNCMRILLCNPENDVWSSRKHIPLGLGYMASSLEAAGHTVRIYDSSVEDEALADVLAQGWDFAGVSSTGTVRSSLAATYSAQPPS